MDETSWLPVSQSRGRPGLAIKIDGPRVGEARLSANDLARILLRTQQVLKRIGQVLYGESPIGEGRKKKDIEQLCELFLVGWKPGSAVAEVELAEPPAQMSLFGYVGEESVKAFLNGMARIDAQTLDIPQPMPAGFDTKVLHACDLLGRVLERGINTVHFQPIQVTGVPAITFDRSLREKVRNLLGRPVEQRQVEKIGRLEVLDGHRGLQGRLWEPDGTKWLCIFKPEHLEILPEAWLRTVRLVGEAVVEPGKERTLHVASVLPLEQELGETAMTEELHKVPFWTSLPLEQLAELQGVQPATDLDSIGELWPADDDPDRMFAHILDERSARRRMAQGDDSR